MQNAVWNIVSIALGILFASFVNWWFYIRASRDLKLETKKLRNLLRIVLQALEDAKMVKLNRDASGEIIGMIFDTSVEFSIHSSMDANATQKVKEKQSPKETTNT